MGSSKIDFNDANDDLLKLLKESKQISGIWEAYNIKLTNLNTVDKTAKGFYIETVLLAALAEAFTTKTVLTLQELNQLTADRIPESFVWEITASSYHSMIIRAIKLGYFKVLEPNEKGMPVFQLTEVGIKLLQEQTLQNLAATNFFNYQTNEFNKRAYKINRLAISIAIISLIATILSLIVAIYALA